MSQTNVNTGGSTNCGYGRNGSITGAVNLRSAHTIAIRVRHTSTATNYDSICVGYTTTTSGNESGSLIGRFSGNGATVISFYRYDGLFTFNTATATAYGSTSAWVHLCLTYDGTTIRSYVDGVAGGTVASSSTLTTNTTTTRFWAGGPHPGVFCDATLFNRALSADEVALLAEARAAPAMLNGCIGWFPEFGDNVTSDLSGNGNTLSVINSGTGTTPTASNENPPNAWARSYSFYARSTPISISSTSSTSTNGAAQVNRVYSLTATGSTSTSGSAAMSGSLSVSSSTQTTGAAQVLVQNNGPIRSTVNTSYIRSDIATNDPGSVNALGSQTIACWVRSNADISSGGYINVCELTHSNGLGYISIYLGSGTPGTTSLILDVRPSTFSAVLTNVGVSTGTWHHVAITYNGQSTTASCYVDGSLVTSGIAAIPAGNWQYMNVFGDLAPPTTFDVSVQDVVRYGTALSISSVRKLMCGDIPFPGDVTFRERWLLQRANPTKNEIAGRTDPSTVSTVGGLVTFLTSPSWPLYQYGSSQSTGSAVVSSSTAVSGAGDTATSGSAQVGITYAVAASSSTSTSGSTFPFVTYFGPSGSTATSGSAQVGISYAFAIPASGQVSTSGTATLSGQQSILPVGSVATSGSATLETSVGIAASGGSISTAGTVTLTPTQEISAAGSASTSGTSTGLVAAAALAGAGSTSTSGSSTGLDAAAQLAASSSTSTTGVSSFAGTVQSNGSTTTTGSVTMTAAAALVGAGSTSASGGPVTLVLVIGGLGATQAPGAAVVTASAVFAPSGATSTSGAAVVGKLFLISAVTSTVSSGAAVTGYSIAEAGTGQTATSGSAAFTGVVTTNAQVAETVAQRRYQGALGARRRLRR